MRKHTKKSKVPSTFEKYWLISIILIMSVFYIWMLNFTGTLLWDEMIYLSNARSQIGPSFFHEDFRFPLLELVIGGSWLITGESILVAQLIIILFSLAGIFGFGLLAKEYLSPKMSAIATIFFASASPLLLWGFRIYTDVPAMTLSIFAVYFFIKYLRKQNEKYIFITGLFCSLAFLMRFPTIIIAVVIGIYTLRSKWKKIKLFILGNLLVLTPWLVINTIAYNNPIWDFMSQSHAVSTYTIWQSPILLIEAIQHTFSYSLIFLIPFLYWCFQKRKEKKVQVLFLLLTTHIITYLFFVNLKFERYILMFLPFIVLSIILGIEELKTIAKNYIPITYARTITYIICILLVLPILSYSLENIEKNNDVARCEKDGALDQATKYVAQTVPMGETILSNHWPWFGYYGNHQTLAIYNSSISSILDLHHVKPSTVAYMRYQGLYFNTSELQTDSRLILDREFKDECGFYVSIYKVDKSLSLI